MDSKLGKQCRPKSDTTEGHQKNMDLKIGKQCRPRSDTTEGHQKNMDLDIGKQCRPRSDTTELGLIRVCTVCLNNRKLRIKMKQSYVPIQDYFRSQHSETNDLPMLSVLWFIIDMHIRSFWKIRPKGHCITKTRLFKYIENLTTKTENFQIKKNLIFFIFLLKI